MYDKTVGECEVSTESTSTSHPAPNLDQKLSASLATTNKLVKENLTER